MAPENLASRAQARDKVKRIVVLLCEIPEGRMGRPSKSLTLPQAEALLDAAQVSSMNANVVLSLIGARTEELRALTWSHVELVSKPATAGIPAMPPSIMVWRSVRTGGYTRVPQSRRGGRARPRSLDAEGATAQLHLADVRRWRSCRADRPAGLSQR